MRLTLRTLLAWLDDTLSPAEVKEIGKQVAEVPFAKQLVEKIHRVTRQRRLTVPPRSGPDAVDANVVACYLDNELPADEVAEFEKRCLASDVHLAEVASVHQVLSLIGHKAKVPTEARQRMYGLVKGRESARSQTPRSPRKVEKKKVAEPISPWITPLPPSPPIWKQFGPAALVLGLIVILGWTATKSMTSDQARPPELALSGLSPTPADEKDAASQTKSTASATAPVAPENQESDGVDSSNKKPAALAEPKKDDEKVEAKPQIPAGSAGVAKLPSGLLLHYVAKPDKADSGWERLTKETPLVEQDRLLSLTPFRSTIELGSGIVDLVGDSEIWVGVNAPTLAAKFSLSQGRVILHGTPSGLPFEIGFAGKSVRVTPPPGSTVGVERVYRRDPGEPVALAPILKFYGADGSVEFTDGTNEETLVGPGMVSYEMRGKWSDKLTKPVPAWVTETSSTPFDKQVGEQYLKLFPPGRKVMADLVEASEDENKDICRYGISGLRAIGDVSFIVPLLNKEGTPNAAVQRKAAIHALRTYIAEGPDSLKTLEKQVEDALGSELVPTVMNLLVGVRPVDAKSNQTFDRLVQYLAPSDGSPVCVRELALDNLQELTGRDSLDYDPEKPEEGKGLKAWRDLNHSRELKPASGSTKNGK